MSIEIGGVLEGTVSGITNFGAFIDLPEGKNGLVHISEVADVYVSDVNDYLTTGQKVRVKVLAIDEKGRIGLSIKRVEPKTAPAAKPSNTANPAVQTKQAAPPRPAIPSGKRFGQSGGRFPAGPRSFEDKLKDFLKDSDERLTTLKRKMDGKRGGRGSRRSD